MIPLRCLRLPFELQGAYIQRARGAQHDEVARTLGTGFHEAHQDLVVRRDEETCPIPGSEVSA